MDERGREVEPAAHAAGVGLERPVGRVGRDRSARAARPRADPRVSRLAGGVSAPTSRRFSRPVRHLVDGRVLPGEPDAEPHRLRVPRDVDAEHLGAAESAGGSS